MSGSIDLKMKRMIQGERKTDPRDFIQEGIEELREGSRFVSGPRSICAQKENPDWPVVQASAKTKNKKTAEQPDSDCGSCKFSRWLC